MASIPRLDELLGYTSIACWLGAQFPQVLENHRRRSVEGLALPFLANWFLGDASNLLGCLLTHQLPFQTYLATYFVFVDLILVSQFIHYRNVKPAPSAFSSHPRSRAASATTRRVSTDRGGLGPVHYRTLSAVAANVAAAAALAAQQDEQADPRYASSRWGLGGSRDNLREDADIDDGALAALSDSMLSEHSGKHVSWSTERRSAPGPSRSRNAFLPSAHATVESPVDYTLDRGRHPQRDADTDLEPPPDSATVRRSSRASRRGAGLVFLGAWALFGIGTLAGGRRAHGTLAGGRRAHTSTAVYTGQVLVNPPAPVVSPSLYSPVVAASLDVPSSITIRVRELDDDIPLPDKPPPSESRLIGRIFAWACTVLYFTSRLPQVSSQNGHVQKQLPDILPIDMEERKSTLFTRKSVDGLSMYLFVFAFLGNVFYVASILLSPKVFEKPPISTEFIQESIPYLIGSGGTLVFDVTIVAQSFIYRPKPRVRGRASSRSRRMSIGEEETGLLSGGADSAFEPSAESTHSRGIRTSSWSRAPVS